MPAAKNRIKALVLLMAVAAMPAWGASAADPPPQENSEAAAAAKAAKALEEVQGALAGGDDKKIARNLEALAKSGNAKAQAMIGDLYLEGKGVEANNSMAWHWYKRAAENEDAEGQFKLAELYRLGVGVPFSLAGAAEWYAKAAEKDHLKAQKHLGLLYAGKFGSSKVDKKKAEEWLDMAAKKGDVEAEQALDELYDSGYESPFRQGRTLSVDEADIDTDVGFIHMVITNAINAMIPPNATMKMNGPVRVAEEDQGWFAVSIPDFAFVRSDGSGVSFAESGLKIKPEDGNIKDAHAYRVNVTLPARIRATMVDMNNSRKLVITHNQKRFNGLWHPESNRFAEADIELTNILIKEPEKSLTVAADRFVIAGNRKGASPGTSGGVYRMGIAKIAVTTPGVRLASLESMEITGNIGGFDDKAFTDNIRLISQNAMPKTTSRLSPDASRELTKKMALTALRAAPNMGVDLKLVNLEINDDKGKSVGSLGGLNFSAAWGLEMPYAALSLAYAHNNLKAADSRSQAVAPHDAAVSIKVERLPIEAVLEALFDRQSFSTAGIRSLSAQAGTKIIARADMNAVKAGLTLDGLLKADAASVYGVSGGFDLAVKGIDKIKEAATKDPKNVEPIFLLLTNMLSDLAVAGPGPDGDDTARFHIDITADGKVLINGNDMATAAANK